MRVKLTWGVVLQIFATEIYTPFPSNFINTFYFNNLTILSIFPPANTPKVPFCNVEIAKLMFTKLFLYCTLTCFAPVFIPFLIV